MLKKTSPLFTHLYYSVLFVFLSFLCVLSPLISDDFEFADLALTSVRSLLPYALYYGNGRLFGNLTGVFLINYPIVCAIMKAATFCALIYLLPRVICVSEKSRALIFAMAPFLILGANPDIMGQIFTWTSGWANFVPPMVIGLFCFYLIRSKNRFSPGIAILITVLGVLGQLYVEHATVVQILLAICLLFHYHKQGCTVKFRYTLYWLIAGICGAALMFAIPKIFFLEGNRTAGYRTFHISDLITNISGSFLFALNTFEQCSALLSVFSVFGILSNQGRSPLSIAKKAVYLLVPVFLGIFPYLNVDSGFLATVKHGFVLLYIVLLLTDIILIKDRQKKISILWLCILAMISTAPFLIITPFGERCMYLSYILLCIAALIGVQYSLENHVINIKALRSICHGATAAVCIILTFSLIKIHHYDNIRDRYIRQQIAEGQSQVTIFDLPTRYSFNTYLPDLYYYDQQPRDVKFEFIDLEEWMQIYYENP